MNPEKNVIPEKVQTIHLTAICGTGMGALAGMLKEAGYQITGSDLNVYPPMSTFLESKGIPVIQGFSGDNLAHTPDLVVIGNAVSKDNPEAVAVMEKGLHYCSFPQAIDRFFASQKTPIMVTGTHGKTTTSALIAWLIAAVGLDPTFMIGGILTNFKSNHQVGTGAYMVIEGDEYDTAFFDKGPKFLHYTPSRTVLTSVEFDHADIFKDLDHVKSAFTSLVKNLPRESLLVFQEADDNIKDILQQADCWLTPYGFGEKAPWRIGEMRTEPPYTFIEVFRRGEFFAEFKVPLMGKHNALNCLAAIAVVDDLRIPVEGIQAGLETFKGVARRQQVRGVKNNITVMDDFAHHPTAVRETIKAVKPFYDKGRVAAVFEPRTNSSRRKVFQDVYPTVFDDADIICIPQPTLLEKIPPEERFSSEKLVEDLKARGKDAHFFADVQGIIDFLAKTLEPGDLALIMSNGGFENIHERLLDAL
ncbi:UDP-N-acetylmuramate:L-alanyl-gamma-D-glutamyl-meso-diaminopimelate ligase [Desulfatibacillum aliphaticivorans]|uniref:UDP-N-acetylmuramate--L-alanine ligase n=1 Tax=Desulfatibacillum aliphaticivorans TaxID=218208 RepID=B8FF87_DESAL|nr:UDP-N-acetylmuramate:L-alanyl-gamma-D-glutamyl-meso-diaminopimelate ligase [Desulfatibacillum aliphaticivorans]ACL03904.1 UDP-N-acetylmuramate [Desulfatibacillum aliphaticivorans]